MGADSVIFKKKKLNTNEHPAAEARPIKVNVNVASVMHTKLRMPLSMKNCIRNSQFSILGVQVKKL
jgi:hypothetical protein